MSVRAAGGEGGQAAAERACASCGTKVGDGPWSICFDPEWERNVWGGDTHRVAGALCGDCAERLVGGKAAGDADGLLATRFELKSSFYSPDLKVRIAHPTFERSVSTQYEGERWAVRLLNYCLNKDGKWEEEPIASMRDAGFYARCRFATVGEAMAALDAADAAAGTGKADG